MQFVRRHLTYANVMATVLTFIVLGGTAWALARNSVGTKQLKNNAVTAKKIRNGAITSAKIARGAITGTTINPASFPVTAYQAPVSIANDASDGTTASCPAGKKAIGGGGLSDTGGNNKVTIEDSRPVTDTNIGATQGGTFTGWRVFWFNFSGTQANAIVYVICLG